MDDFLTKPVDTGRLESLLRKHVADRNEEVAGDAAPETVPDDTPDAPADSTPLATVALDPSRLEELDSLGERAMLLVDRAVDNFVRGFPETLAELHEAVARGDREELRATAHRLRGSALNLGALRVAEVGLVVELWDRPTLAGVPELLDQLSEAGDEAAAALREYQGLREDRQAAAS